MRKLVIVGGGSAGWLTAGVLASAHGADRGRALEVTLVESPDIPTIGVGEGTWPTMRDTLRRIGVTETAFIRECEASFKQGSRFLGWVDGRAGDRYDHPFALPQGYGEADLVGAWLELHRDTTFADLVCVQPSLCTAGRAPKQFATPEYAAVTNYAYHLDAGKFGVFLREHCTRKLGVRLVADHVTGLRAKENGDIAALELKSGTLLEGDLFVDCTGMPSLLLGRHYGVKLVPQGQVLFNDRALAMQVPYADERAPIASQTLSTAQPCGWIWDIGLPGRRGIGHVYSAAHLGDDEAETQLRRYVTASGGPADPPPARKLRFEPGYRERFWERNCVAIGLSAGFIEPLEASALALVELSAGMLADQMPATREAMDIVAGRFNENFVYRWQRIIEFLKMHYVLSRREDSAYWRDHRASASIPERLSTLLRLWSELPPSRYDLSRIEEVFPSASWQYVLYGMGFRPAAPVATDPLRAEPHFREAARLSAKMLAALPSNRELIDHVRRQGLSTI